MRLLTIVVQAGLIGATAYCLMRTMQDLAEQWRERMRAQTQLQGRSVWRPE